MVFTVQAVTTYLDNLVIPFSETLLRNSVTLVTVRVC